MQFISTQGQAKPVLASEAMIKGLADDQGLYVPSEFPKINHNNLAVDQGYATFASQFLDYFFIDDPLREQLPAICADALNFPVPLVKLDEQTYFLELFHGPTLSFKDVGARFLAASLESLQVETTILVATSGDTGSAVASAFYQRPNAKVVVLYPHNKITRRQEHQITCWGDNVTALAVSGNFDDCQRMVKTVLAMDDASLGHLSTANSINVGRLLPQMTYYAYHAVRFYREHQRELNIIIPSGNFGNATACCYARACGFPIGEIVMSTNANRVLVDYLATGEYQPRASEVTLANAMDVGAPSNFARLQHLFGDFAGFQAGLRAVRVDDDEIRETIQYLYRERQQLVCPHTATAYAARQRCGGDGVWMLAATADPCKFETILEPLLGVAVPCSQAMLELLQRSTQHDQIPDDVAVLLDVLRKKA